MQRCVDEVLTAEGRLDVLVTNARVGQRGALEGTSIEEAAWQMDTNVFGVPQDRDVSGRTSWPRT